MSPKCFLWFVYSNQDILKVLFIIFDSYLQLSVLGWMDEWLDGWMDESCLPSLTHISLSLNATHFTKTHLSDAMTCLNSSLIPHLKVISLLSHSTSQMCLFTFSPTLKILWRQLFSPIKFSAPWSKMTSSL